MKNRSGGPRTAKGKAVTRYNAAKHGIYSVTPVLPNVERQADWLKHRAGVFNDLQPEGYIQEIIAERIARPVMSSSWPAARETRLLRHLHDAELHEDAQGVHVVALADEFAVAELHYVTNVALNPLTGRSDAAPGACVCAAKVKLRCHRVAGDVDILDVDAHIREAFRMIHPACL
jgi:hypothetical protein